MASLDNSHAFVPLVQQCIYKVTNPEYLKPLPWCKLTKSIPHAILCRLLCMQSEKQHSYTFVLSVIKLNTTKRHHAPSLQICVSGTLSQLKCHVCLCITRNIALGHGLEANIARGAPECYISLKTTPAQLHLAPDHSHLAVPHAILASRPLPCAIFHVMHSPRHFN